jgi:two-component system phosphate regulon response regulator PhoB
VNRADIAAPSDVTALELEVAGFARRSHCQAHEQFRQLVLLAIDVDRREVQVYGRPPKEYELLLFFVNEPGKVHSREELLRRVWHTQPGLLDMGTVTEHIRRLRIKLGDDQSTARWIRTVRDWGYMFERRAVDRDGAVIALPV